MIIQTSHLIPLSNGDKVHLRQIVSDPNGPVIFLMHGANDEIVSPMHLLEAKEYFNNHGIKIKTKLFNNCEHKIPVDGLSLGLGFIE